MLLALRDRIRLFGQPVFSSALTLYKPLCYSARALSGTVRLEKSIPCPMPG